MDEELLLQLLTGQRDVIITVCRISYWQRVAVDAVTNKVVLTPDYVMHTETKRHSPNLRPYTLAPWIIENGMCRLKPPKHLIYIHRIPGDADKPWESVVKRSRDGNLYLVSTHRIQERRIKRTMKETRAIYGEEWREVGPPK